MEQTSAVRRAGEDLIRCCHHLAAVGLVTAAAGNASVRVSHQLLITASGARFAELTPDDLVLLDEGDGRVGQAAASMPPSSELLLHLDVYRRRPDVGAVMHTHGRHAVALSAVADSVPAVHYYCLDLGGTVPVAAYRTFGTAELAEVTTTALGTRNAVVMANHGSLTVGADLTVATARAELLEWLCEVGLLALAAGTPRTLDQAALDAVASRARQGRQQ